MRCEWYTSSSVSVVDSVFESAFVCMRAGARQIRARTGEGQPCAENMASRAHLELDGGGVARARADWLRPRTRVAVL
jgi:hypothetical protein